MYVQRDQGNSIKGCFRQPQPGYAEEELPDNHPDVVAFLNPPPDPRKVLDDAERAEVVADNQVITFLNFTPQQLDTWVDNNIGTAATLAALRAACVIAFKVLGRIALAAARGKPLR